MRYLCVCRMDGRFAGERGTADSEEGRRGKRGARRRGASKAPASQTSPPPPPPTRSSRKRDTTIVHHRRRTNDDGGRRRHPPPLHRPKMAQKVCCVVLCCVVRVCVLCVGEGVSRGEGAAAESGGAFPACWWPRVSGGTRGRRKRGGHKGEWRECVRGKKFSEGGQNDEQLGGWGQGRHCTHCHIEKKGRARAEHRAAAKKRARGRLALCFEGRAVLKGRIIIQHERRQQRWRLKIATPRHRRRRRS